jgi:hypothetical protein
MNTAVTAQIDALYQAAAAPGGAVSELYERSSALSTVQVLEPSPAHSTGRARPNEDGRYLIGRHRASEFGLVAAKLVEEGR